MRPTVGRIVHWVEDGGIQRHCAAIVVELSESGNPTLNIHRPGFIWCRFDVPEDQGAKLPGTWHWPEREGE